MADAPQPETPATPAATEADKPPVDPKKPIMSVKVYAPFKVYFEGDAVSLSAVNATGPFDILPRHHNFLCMLVPCTLTVHTAEGQKKDIKIHRALMHVKSDHVSVFVDV